MCMTFEYVCLFQKCEVEAQILTTLWEMVDWVHLSGCNSYFLGQFQGSVCLHHRHTVSTHNLFLVWLCKFLKSFLLLHFQRLGQTSFFTVSPKDFFCFCSWLFQTRMISVTNVSFTLIYFGRCLVWVILAMVNHALFSSIARTHFPLHYEPWSSF